jgi:hypothetical protein
MPYEFECPPRAVVVPAHAPTPSIHIKPFYQATQSPRPSHPPFVCCRAEHHLVSMPGHHRAAVRGHRWAIWVFAAGNFIDLGGVFALYS